jgi:hypothetical protein
MDDRPTGAAQRFHRAPDQVLARLGENLDSHLRGDVPALDEAAHEVELGLRRRGKSDLDFLEADLAKQAEETHLAFEVHRLEQRLVAVAQVGTHPDRRLADAAARPMTVGEVDGREGTCICWQGSAT